MVYHLAQMLFVSVPESLGKPKLPSAACGSATLVERMVFGGEGSPVLLQGLPSTLDHLLVEWPSLGDILSPVLGVGRAAQVAAV